MVDESAATVMRTDEIKKDQDDLTPPEEATTEEPTAMILEDLVILPPRQKDQKATDGLLLPVLRPDEPIQSLRGALSEVVGYAHITNFRFELEEEPPKIIKKNEKITVDSVISPYTGKDAVISVPLQLKNLDPMHVKIPIDEYGDLSPLLERGLKSGSGFRMVLERYDAASVKDHVTRLRSLMDGNAPTVTMLVENKESTKEAGSKEDDETEDADKESKQDDDAKDKKTLPSLNKYEKSNAADLIFDGKNLGDFFYLACGENYSECHGKSTLHETPGRKSNKKKKKGGTREVLSELSEVSSIETDGQNISRWNELEELVRVDCVIQYSSFHPPPPHRRLLGDIAYYSVTTVDEIFHITANSLGFYVNQTSEVKGKLKFDPAPAAEPHFSHAMLDCLLQASQKFQDTWTYTLLVAKERADLSAAINKGTFTSLFHIATRGDFEGFTSASVASQATAQALESSLVTPSWLVPNPRLFEAAPDSWNRNHLHGSSRHRADDDSQNNFGVDLRTGALRDWNEELQLAREMPTETLAERIDRARLIHKVMVEFGEASLLGVKAISDGHVAPMNPNEATRSQVYLHNNIFFSRGVDAGPETFKVAKGDRAARKSANRDVQCIGTFHRMENSTLHTLATVLVDYLGTRFVCQSILPGILIGEKSHTLLYGAVETGVPLKWDEELHKILEEKIGGGMMLATRPIFQNPLTQERIDEIKAMNKDSPLYVEAQEKMVEEKESDDPNAVVKTCVPIEAKGILGSDQRKYVLDFGRLTPRDANWVPVENGGTGRIEELKRQNGSKTNNRIPSTLVDDEWITCVLRPELVTRFTQMGMTKYLQETKQKQKEPPNTVRSGDDTTSSDTAGNDLSETNDKNTESDKDHGGLSEEDKAYLKCLRLNVNVFLPHVRRFDGIDEEAAAQIKADENLAREAAEYLWDSVLPSITRAIKDGSVHQMPVDGKTLTEFLHRNGVNCRYLGALANLAKNEEEADAKVEADLKQGRTVVIERRLMPKFWLELLECEMVARAAKHVLDDYLTEKGGVAASQPAQTVASFLSALVSEREETAAQTETRLEKRSYNQPDDDDVAGLTIAGVGGDGDAMPMLMRGRSMVWNDIEAEIGRRFRYSLTLYNTGNKPGRALYIPLLRRVCQRSGVRLVAKNYDVGGTCLCSGGNSRGGQLSLSVPIAPMDITEIIPLMKHCAAYSEGFAPCTLGSSIGLPSLQVSLPDARVTLERAHIQTSGRVLAKGLELAQEAAHLYQRVTENAAHPGVIESLELMATIFSEAGDSSLAVTNGAKVLGLIVQNCGFDSATAMNSHLSLFQILYAAREMDLAVKHLRAAIYLLELMAGPRHTEHFSAYHKLGTVFSHADYDGKYLATALEYFKEASKRESCDRLIDGVTAKNYAKILAGTENYKDALEYEKKALQTLATFLGKDHALTKECDEELQVFAKLAVEKGNRFEATEKMRADAARADSIAASLVAEEATKKNKPAKKKKKSKK
jgi:protein TIF31